MLMVGKPICTGCAVTGGASPGVCVALRLPRANPAAAPPPANAAKRIHLRFPPPPDLGDFATGVSEMYCEQIVPARDSPLAAVTRTCRAPGTRFQRIPCTAARPSVAVIAMSVFMPPSKAPLGPSSGSRKLTATPSRGRPVSSVSRTAMGRSLFDPAELMVPSPSRI